MLNGYFITIYPHGLNDTEKLHPINKNLSQFVYCSVLKVFTVALVGI